MSSGTLADGTVFAGRYRVIRCIATGGMGSVYEVVHMETERHRALKVLHPQFLHNDDLRSRFRREARVAAKVESKHIVDVFDAGIDETTGMPFLVMELLRGEEIGKRLTRVQRFAPAEVLSYLHQTALALDKTHRASIVHRDLKPDNLFLCEHDDGPPSIKVLDFGIAKLVAEGSAEAQATRSLGTPMYMAPEQFRSAAAISPATDIFALGMIAYTLLVGAPYWIEESKASGNVFEFVGAAAGGPREPPTARALRRGVTLPPAFDAWFARTTAPSPADRFPSASAAVQALAYALGLPQPGQEPYAASSTAAAAQTGPPAALTGATAAARSAVPPVAVGSSGAAAPWVGSATPAAMPGAASRGSGTELLPATISAVTPVGPGTVVPTPPITLSTPSESHAIPAASRRTGLLAAIAISAAMLVAGGAAVYYTVQRVLSPHPQTVDPADPSARPVVAAPSETPGTKGTPLGVVSATEASPPPTTPAAVTPQGSAADSSAPSLPSSAPVSAASTPSRLTPQQVGRPSGTAPPNTQKKASSIHSRD